MARYWAIAAVSDPEPKPGNQALLNRSQNHEIRSGKSNRANLL